VVHIDGTLIRANVSWGLIARPHAEAGEAANSPAEPVSRTAPDARLTCNHRARRGELASKQHTAVDDEAGGVGRTCQWPKFGKPPFTHLALALGPQDRPSPPPRAPFQ
jgi:hypothetical protein